eukprot:gene27911-34697_t
MRVLESAIKIANEIDFERRIADILNSSSEQSVKDVEDELNYSQDSLFSAVDTQRREGGIDPDESILSWFTNSNSKDGEGTESVVCEDVGSASSQSQSTVLSMRDETTSITKNEALSLEYFALLRDFEALMHRIRHTHHSTGPEGEDESETSGSWEENNSLANNVVDSLECWGTDLTQHSSSDRPLSAREAVRETTKQTPRSSRYFVSVRSDSDMSVISSWFTAARWLCFALLWMSPPLWPLLWIYKWWTAPSRPAVSIMRIRHRTENGTVFESLTQSDGVVVRRECWARGDDAKTLSL